MKGSLNQVVVQGVSLTYLDQGQGVPVVFVHGAFSDHRVWEAQRQEISKTFRYIAVDMRYFGSAPWQDDGSQYSAAIHASDLAAFIEQLNAGPVHVVAWSYGGTVALVLAAQRADLIRSLFLNEPALGSLVVDPAEQAAMVEERKGFAPIVAASSRGDYAQAVQLLADFVNNLPGSFAGMPAPLRAILLDNGRTLRPHFAAQPSTITCAHFQNLNVPVTVAKGQESRPFFTILADATHRCISASRLVVIPNSRHMAPVQNAPAFNAALLSHLDACSPRAA